MVNGEICGLVVIMHKTPDPDQLQRFYLKPLDTGFKSSFSSILMQIVYLMKIYKSQI